MSDPMKAIQEQLQMLIDKANKYEEKHKRSNECARMHYHRKMARERGITLEEWFANRPKMGRPKKVEKISS